MGSVDFRMFYTQMIPHRKSYQLEVLMVYHIGSPALDVYPSWKCYVLSRYPIHVRNKIEKYFESTEYMLNPKFKAYKIKRKIRYLQINKNYWIL